MNREQRTGHILLGALCFAEEFNYQPFTAAALAHIVSFSEKEVLSVLETYSGNRGETVEQFPNYFTSRGLKWMIYDVPRLKTFVEGWRKRIA